MKNKKGFTLIELLAVIVILGLLMAIAIPSVTKYITQSKKKTVVSTIGNYVGALVNEVNDLSYTFTGTNTIYAVPIECISLERGGINPFGEWLQANDNYWAYVLVQYDDVNSSYTYGFTFKDSSGYVMYPTSEEKLNSKGGQIKVKLTLKKPVSGKITNIADVDKWDGFSVNANTDLIVLEAESEGVPGDGVETCTLYNKGNNYDQVEQDKIDRLPSLPTLILKHNEVIKDKPTLTDSSNNTSDKSGLYSSNATTNEKVTYYFRGDVKNNYVKFANLTWKIIRINEDGTVRLMLNDRVGGKAHLFKNEAVTFEDMYYSNGSNAKAQVDNWYTTTIANTKYDEYVVNGIFCEQAKAKISESWTSGNADMIYFENYEPNFDCDTDGNGRGLLLNADGSCAKVGLITYDEMVHAGGYYNKENKNYYLYNGSYGIWSMSPGGFSSTAYLWMMRTQGILIDRHVKYGYNLQPVINIKGDLKAKGTGLFDDPYILLTN